MPHNHIGGDSRDKFPELEPIFAAVEGAMGYLPNAYLGMAKRPELLKAFSGLVATIFASDGIDQASRQLIALAVSLSAGSKYCQAHTSHGAERAGVTDDKISAILNYKQSDHFSDKEKALLDLAYASGRTPNESNKEHFTDLKKYYSEEQITDIVSVISIFGFLNRWNDTLGTELEDVPKEYVEQNLRPLGWS